MNKPSLQQRLGIIGGGQLGKMMIQASSKWSVKTVVLDPSPACPAAPLCDELIVAGFRDAQGLEAVASKTEVLTCEFEHISTEGLKQLEEKGYTVYPTSEALKIIQNKYEQKMTLKRHGLPVGPFVLVPDQEQLDVVGKTFGYPFMLKTATEAYDGKGNHRVDDPEQGKVAYDFLAQRSNVIYAEAFIDFEKEISILCCRGKNGDTVTYPVSENIHVDSILFETLAPARIKEEQALQARNIAIEISHLFGTVGICCVEIFLDAEGALLINEVAPRPHNSGHYTIEACVTSQFENHVRAVLGLPLGSTRQLSPAIMRNLLGEPEHMGRPVVEGVQQAFAIEGFNLHLYGKEETRPQRKMGHFTVLAPTTDEAKEKADLAHSLLKIITDTSPRKEG